MENIIRLIVTLPLTTQNKNQFIQKRLMLRDFNLHEPQGDKNTLFPTGIIFSLP